MNILDENILEGQRQLLHDWHIPTRHIRYDVGRRGMSDEDIIPLLRELPQPTFFTCDEDFYRPVLCHARYCLVYLDVHRARLPCLSVACCAIRNSILRPVVWAYSFAPRPPA